MSLEINFSSYGFAELPNDLPLSKEVVDLDLSENILPVIPVEINMKW